jgi:hypothetical protein
MIAIRSLKGEDREKIIHLLEERETFSRREIDVATEVIVRSIAHVKTKTSWPDMSASAEFP